MPDTTFTDFLRAQAAALRANDKPPANRAAWAERRTALRADMLRAAGPMPETPCDLKPQILGTLDRDGYRVEKLIFQSRPHVWVSSNVYVPAGDGKRPAVLAVHGHHAWARIDRDVQAYCLGLVKLGFFVLCVDAFGAGERHERPARGTYHGALDGSALWPVGQSLLGMQVYDNRRAVDYLLTRPEVDGERLGVTGASGGGNQTMYVGALDERVKCVVPVCSVGNYQAYFHVACCVCEVLPGVLQFTEEGDVLGLVAPRPLLVISAEKDSFQFSPAEAAKSVGRAKHIYDLSGGGENLRHTVVEGGHGYSKPMREAMYGWMTRWLKGEGTGEPIPDPPFQTEDPETIRCFPDITKRPQPWLTPTTFAKQTGKSLLKENFPKVPDHAEAWESTAVYMRSQLAKVLGPMPAVPKDASLSQGRIQLTAELGLTIAGTCSIPAKKKVSPACVVFHLDGAKAAAEHPVSAALAAADWAVIHPELRGAGPPPTDRGGVRGAPDHNVAEQGVLLGRPLLGQWVFDLQVVVEALIQKREVDRQRVVLVGIGQAGFVALAAAAFLGERIAGVVTFDPPSTLQTDAPYAPPMRMGLLAPGIVRVGDVPQLAAMIAPRRLVIAGGVAPDGKKLSDAALKEAFAFTTAAYKANRASDRLTIAADVKVEDVVKSL
jgi:cephalosporin-C deacetylase-like acetyl esterase